jgi:hypothetical protein
MDSLIAVGSNLKTKGPAGFPIAPKYASHSLPLGSIGVVTKNIGNALKSARIAGAIEGGISQCVPVACIPGTVEGAGTLGQEDPPFLRCMARPSRLGSLLIAINTGVRKDQHSK